MSLPLTVVFISGLLMSGISFIVLLLVLVFRIFDIPIFGMRASDVQGFSSTILTILLIGGIQLISTGVLGEYIGRIYTEAKGRPTYVILDKIVHPDNGLSSRTALPSGTAGAGMLRSPPMARVTDDTA
jgi:glycosyltransferase involved in cell wall biosynthesis